MGSVNVTEEVLPILDLVESDRDVHALANSWVGGMDCTDKSMVVMALDDLKLSVLLRCWKHRSPGGSSGCNPRHCMTVSCVETSRVLISKTGRLVVCLLKHEWLRIG